MFHTILCIWLLANQQKKAKNNLQKNASAALNSVAFYKPVTTFGQRTNSQGCLRLSADVFLFC